MRYLQLTHNEWDPATKTSRPKVLHSFGREDQLDRDAIQRLVASLTRLLDPATALRSSPGAGPAELAFTSSRPVGGTLVLDALWRRLGIDTVMTRLLAGRKRDPRTERVLFALVANRALAPGSKLAAAGWVNRRPTSTAWPRPATTPATGRWTGCSTSPPTWSGRCSGRSPPCSITRSTCCSSTPPPPTSRPTNPTPRSPATPTAGPSPNRRPPPDAPRGRHHPGRTTRTHHPGRTAAAGDTADGVGFRTYGKSKDSRDDLPQVVIGMAVTRAGIPVRVWCWPGNTTDSALIRQAREDMRDWTLARVMWVADRGFSSAENRRELRRGGGHYIIGEKLRSGSAEATAALSRQGRYQHVRDNLQVKEVKIADRRAVRDLLQPRTSRPRRRAARDHGRQAHRPDRRHRPAERRRSGPSCAGGSPPCPG